MEIKDLEKAGDLLSEYKKRLKNIRQVLNITDPKFRPTDAAVSKDGKELCILSESGEVIRKAIQVHIFFTENSGINSKAATIYDLNVGLIWIKQEIEGLNKIEKLINEL